MKEITEQQALYKLTTLCSKSEHCTGEMVQKMTQWGIGAEAQQRILDYLTREKYIDDTRFCRAFINDKIRYNGWGRRKIEQALRQRQVPRSVSDPVFEEVEDAEYVEVLRPLLQQKWRSIKGHNDQERSLKLIRFALGRGFSMDIVRKCIDGITQLPDD